jgi:hypothetical protein
MDNLSDEELVDLALQEREGGQVKVRNLSKHEKEMRRLLKNAKQVAKEKKEREKNNG